MDEDNLFNKITKMMDKYEGKADFVFYTGCEGTGQIKRRTSLNLDLCDHPDCYWCRSIETNLKLE